MQRKQCEIQLAKKRAGQYRKAYGEPRRSGVNLFRKRSAFGCGRARCQLCHYSKLFDCPQPRDTRADEALRFDLADEG